MSEKEKRKSSLEIWKKKKKSDDTVWCKMKKVLFTPIGQRSRGSSRNSRSSELDLEDVPEAQDCYTEEVKVKPNICPLLKRQRSMSFDTKHRFLMVKERKRKEESEQPSREEPVRNEEDPAVEEELDKRRAMARTAIPRTFLQ